MNNKSIEIPLEYRIRNSTLNKDVPAIFLLHGFGSNMGDLFSLSQFFSDEWAVISLQASESIGFGGYAWAELDFSNLRELPKPEQKVESINNVHGSILKLKENLNFDEDEIYILGFSQGADLALSTGFKFPNFYKGIISLCGYFDTKKIEYDLNYDALKKLKIFLSSAVYDDKVPVHLGRMTHLSLKKMKLSPTYFEYNTGHTISNECLTNVLDWLSLTKK